MPQQILEAVCLSIVGITHPELTVHLHLGVPKTGSAIQKEQNKKVGIGVNTKAAEEEEQAVYSFCLINFFPFV